MEEIKETEIRIIGQSQPYQSRPNVLPTNCSIPIEKRRHRHEVVICPEGRFRIPWKWIIFFIIIILIGLATLLFLWPSGKTGLNEEFLDRTEAMQDTRPHIESSYQESNNTDKNISNLTKENIKINYCNIGHTVVNDVPFKIYDPGNCVPELYVGKIESTDNQIILACQAADIREDNGGIVGSCIYNGEIISKGLSKVGFVAIINGKIKIGAELNSPYFEEAIQSNGSFFRQYALVKDGLLIDSNLNNKSIRRAICELNGKILVIESEDRESFHDFSQALVDYGVQNAVYLVGSSYAHGFCRQNSESLDEWGDSSIAHHPNVTYIVWKNK